MARPCLTAGFNGAVAVADAFEHPHRNFYWWLVGFMKLKDWFMKKLLLEI